MASRGDIITELTTASNRATTFSRDALLEPKFLICCMLVEGCGPT